MATALRLAAQSRDALETYLSRALLLAAEAVEVTRSHGDEERRLYEISHSDAP